MSFIDVQINAKTNIGFAGGPEWRTLVVQMASGRNRRRQEWSMPHHKYTADYTTLRPQDQNDILAAFIAAKGQMHTFAMRDWNDYRARGEVIGQGDGTTTPVQLVKTYAFGPASYVRPITLPVERSVRVYQGGVLVASTVDRLTGLVTPDAPWEDGVEITADFDFNVRVRFASDYFPFTRDSNVSAQTTVELVEEF
ncbi:conserved hypothetical protein [Delftia acidovorans SPH-1]|uniref:DUF2460 domain-containing protein n=1 Tax=Delftia acidovorans (strain DSM 14801 / SPH-1) TaxID=398578 RepID=A9C0E8_DELAS|nr:DUF2460 domain-containing protein [Delftia acidovorans]ABX36714.1 conserved hypothetical protein [Delftia acidovorans SPH-1]QPS74036.1 DUF2460 domain-containing protein [Delftia acidovorans]